MPLILAIANKLMHYKLLYIMLYILISYMYYVLLIITVLKNTKTQIFSKSDFLLASSISKQENFIRDNVQLRKANLKHFHHQFLS